MSRAAKVERPKTIVFAGDTHTGSRYGLNPEDILPEKYATGGRYLLECWKWILDKLPAEIDLLFLMGDLIDGVQHKSDGTKLVTADLSEQAEAAAEVLKPLADRAKAVYRVHGTPYHESFHGSVKLLDAELGVKKHAQVLDVDLGTGILNVAHHPMGGHVLYRGTASNREALWSTWAAAKKKVPFARWIVRAHHHEWGVMELEGQQVVHCPCMKLQDPHAAKQSYWKYQPSLGVVLAVPDPIDEDDFHFKGILCDPPKRTVIRRW